MTTKHKKSTKNILSLLLVGITILILDTVNIKDATSTPRFLNSLNKKIPLNEKTKLILCNNQIYENYESTPFILEGPDVENPSIKKIIRNCTFKNSTKAPIVIKSARNVLIINNHFENIRTNQAGKDVHAISIAGSDDTKCLIDNVTIRYNSFTTIGGDGIQLGVNANNIKNIVIQNNSFVGGEEVGENGIDVKGVMGPVHIERNKFRGFRPCESETQDCSGGHGVGLTIHEGPKSGPAQNVRVENNEFSDNNTGIVVANSNNHEIRNNSFHDNIELGLEVRNVNNIKIIANRFFGNFQSLTIYNNVTNCFYSDNRIEQENFSPKSWGGCQKSF